MNIIEHKFISVDNFAGISPTYKRNLFSID